MPGVACRGPVNPDLVLMSAGMADSTVVGNSYGLVTAAFNEAAFIEKTIRSVIAQTYRPVRWVIVSDGSTDGTDEIVKRYAAGYSFIHLHRITEKHPRNFAAQVNAINAGVALLKGTDCEFIGNLDADVSMDPGYFDQLLARFRKDPRLGLGGGFIFDKCEDGRYRNRKMNNARSVAHAVQLFRRECFESVGAYVPLPYGGPDTHAETAARMKGWRVEAFRDLPVLHERPTGSVGGIVRSSFRQGRLDYSLGYHPMFEIVKSIRRVWLQPRILGALSRWAGFCYCYCRGENRPVSNDFITFLRAEQMHNLRKGFVVFTGNPRSQ